MSEQPTDPAPHRTRSTFGPVLLLGVGGAGLAAVASAKAWYAVPDAGATIDIPTAGGDQFALDMPLASALSLALLACWGVLLVTRGWVRRTLAVLALVTALGLVATVIEGARTLPDHLAAKLATSGAGQSAGSVDAGFTGWFWAAAAGVLVSVAASALAVWLIPTWPTMGTKYDAPTTEESAPVDPENAKDGELWKSMDQGNDPTL